MKRVAIIGAGVSGLACAYHLEELKKEKNTELEVSVFESSSRAGGTIETELRDGFVIEKGPDSFISEKPAALALCRRLGIEDQIRNTQNAHRKVFVVKQGRLIPLPDGFYMVAPTDMAAFMGTPLFSLPAKLRMASELFIPAARGKADESVASFLRRRFGQEALERVGQPMIAGIYSGDPERLSISATLPRFKELEKEHGSVIRGLMARTKNKQLSQKVSGPRYGLFLSFKDGMETLTKTLAARLPAGVLHLNSRVVLDRKLTGEWTVTDERGLSRTVDAVCLGMSASKAALLLRHTDPTLAQLLEQMKFESVATLNLAFRRRDIEHSLDGFGIVVPAVENLSFMACTMSSQKFADRAPEDQVLLRAFIGGAFGKKHYDLPDQELTRAVLTDLGKMLGIQANPVFTALARYPRSLAQYYVGHQDWVAAVEKKVAERPGLYLTGSSYRGTGISDCVRDAELQARTIFQSIF